MGQKISRRNLLKAAGAGVVIVPRFVLGGPGVTPPSEILTRATIGVGPQGFRRMYENTEGGPVQQVAVCDVDSSHLAKALAKTGPRCRGYSDYRKLLEQKDIDTVHIATPDHWHALIAMAALQAGKDVLGEKPMTHTWAEGIKLIGTVKKSRRVFNVNTQGRQLYPMYRKIAKSGVLGWPMTVYLGPATDFEFKLKQWSGRTDLTPQPVPKELDYDFWLGPAPMKPYHPDRVHQKFRGYWDYSAGGLGDMGQHYLDPAQYILGKDETGPVLVETTGPQQDEDAAGVWGSITYTYADGCKIICESGEWGELSPGEKAFLSGPKGKVFGGKRGKQTEPAGLWKLIENVPNEPKMLTFEEAVKQRINTGGEHPNATEGHRSCTLIHLAVMSLRTNSFVKWDPKEQKLLESKGAEEYLWPSKRKPWGSD